MVSKSKEALRDMQIIFMMQLIEVQEWGDLTQLVKVNLELKDISMGKRPQKLVLLENIPM